MKVVYCDGVFDLFHVGHVRHFQKIIKHVRESTEEFIYLIVGVINDVDATNYKRKPIYDENERVEIISGIKYVDRVISDAPLIITREFIDQYNIDRVYHAFTDKSDIDKQSKFFSIPIELGIFYTIEYDNTRSTTQTIEDIKSIV